MQAAEDEKKAGWGVIGMLSAAQFVMVLDTTVMNVSISQIVEDLDTTIQGVQTAITLYTLVMATLMITGGKVGALVGRKRAFAIGCVIYGAGSLTTSVAPSLPVLLLGWSFLEGVGAALILPAIVALVAGNFGAEQRPRAYGLVAASGAIAVALGPLIGGVLAQRYGFESTMWFAAGLSLLAVPVHRLLLKVPAPVPVPASLTSPEEMR